MSPVAESVDAYLAGVREPLRESLEQLRQTITAAVPEKAEVISYGVPTFKYQGRPLVGYGAGKDHVSFFVMSPDVMEAHKAELAAFDTGKGTVRLPPGKRLPEAIVRKLVKARMEETEAALARRAARR